MYGISVMIFRLCRVGFEQDALDISQEDAGHKPAISGNHEVFDIHHDAYCVGGGMRR